MIIELLKDSGFYRIRESFERLLELARLHTENAGSDRSPRFEALPSFIPLEAKPNSHSNIRTTQLLIDIGGTSTKAGVYSKANDKWLVLFDRKNNEFKNSTSSGNLFESYASALGRHIKESLVSYGIGSEDCTHLGFVWSNAMKNHPMTHRSGITGLVTQKDQYRKGEWFVESLRDGDDIGEMLVNGLEKSSLRFDVIIGGNDTCLTMKGVPGAHAGMVASTGLNATVVKTGIELGLELVPQKIICNAEMGGRFYLPEQLIGDFDWISSSEKASTVELLSAGRFLPLLFTYYIKSFAAAGCSELQELAEQLSTMDCEGFSEFRSKDLSLLLSDKKTFLSRRSSGHVYQDQTLSLLEILSKELFLRAAELCVVVAYGSIANQPEANETYNIALDSRLAREVPTFWQHMQTLTRTKLGNRAKIKLTLVEPIRLKDASISVPMIGAANALYDFAEL